MLYAAYRSFDLLRFSNKLEVVAYDLNTHKELQHVTISVPKVHGARASEGFFLSEDGQTLAYAELHEPGLILLLAAKNLSEIRRSDTLPFTSLDHHRMLAGFDHDKLSVASSSYGPNKPNADGLRFIRLGILDFKPVSDTRAIGVSPESSQAIIWLPTNHHSRETIFAADEPRFLKWCMPGLIHLTLPACITTISGLLGTHADSLPRFHVSRKRQADIAMKSVAFRSLASSSLPVKTMGLTVSSCSAAFGLTTTRRAREPFPVRNPTCSPAFTIAASPARRRLLLS